MKSIKDITDDEYNKLNHQQRERLFQLISGSYQSSYSASLSALIGLILVYLTITINPVQLEIFLIKIILTIIILLLYFSVWYFLITFQLYNNFLNRFFLDYSYHKILKKYKNELPWSFAKIAKFHSSAIKQYKGFSINISMAILLASLLSLLAIFSIWKGN